MNCVNVANAQMRFDKGVKNQKGKRNQNEIATVGQADNDLVAHHSWA